MKSKQLGQMHGLAQMELCGKCRNVQEPNVINKPEQLSMVPFAEMC